MPKRRDPKFAIAWDGVVTRSIGGYGDGYPERKYWHTDDIREYWYLLRDHPDAKEGMRFYKMVEIPVEEGMKLMAEGKAQSEEEDREHEIAHHERELARLRKNRKK